MEIYPEYSRARTKGECGVMKVETWTDRKGVMHRSVLTKETTKQSEGFLVDPPDVIHNIDWEQVKIDLHNELVKRGLFERQDVIRGQNQLSSAILAVLRKRVKRLYNRED